MKGEDVSEILRDNNIGLYDLCRYWIYVYPADVFFGYPREIVEIRELMKAILAQEKGDTNE